MPLTAKGAEILRKMEETYGSKKKAEEVFYASKNAGTITGVDAADAGNEVILELRKAIESGELESAAEAEAAKAGRREGEHQKAALGAAGVMLHAPSGRVLFMKRSDKAQDHPGEWCCPGGSIEAGETPHDAMLRELQEETMYGPVEGAEPIDERDGFQTFRADVKEEFTPTLNEEHTEFQWAPMDAPPEPLHPGVAATLKKLNENGLALDRREYDTNNWYEVLDNPLSKVGVYQYSGRSIGGDADPTKMYGVFRPPEELGSEETVKSFRLMPWTDDHPKALLGPKEQGLVPAEEKGVHGVIGEKTYFRADRPEDEDGTLYGNLKIFSESLSRKVPGKRELSCGYHCQFVRQSGVYKGEPYQYVQRNLRGNHVASVDQGRMGSSVRVLDSAERLTFALDLKEIPAMSEIRKDEAEGTVDADTLSMIGDSFNGLVSELEKKGYSKGYATKIAGKVAAEKGMTGHHDSTDSIGVKSMSGNAADATIETKTEEERKKEAADRRTARDSKRGARDSRRANDEMTEEESEAEDAAECAEDAEEEKEDEKDESKEARDRRSARDRRAGARDARKMARDRARDKAAKDAAARDKGKGMDAAEIAALVQRETTAAAEKAAMAAAASARRDTRASDRLYQRLSPLVGAFDHDEMSHAEMAAYGLKKLGQAESKDPVTALDYFLAGRGTQPTETRQRSAAQDSSDDTSFVGRYINGAAA